MGPGTPGVQPEFSPGELALPAGTTGTASPETSPAQTQSIEDLLKGLEIDFNSPTGDDRYAPAGDAPAQEGGPTNPSTETAPPAAADSQNAPPANTPATNDAGTSNTAPAETPSTTPAESTNTPK
jgi:hypothetical protein